MPKKSPTGHSVPVNSPAFPNGQAPAIGLSGAFASALGSKQRPGHLGMALPPRPEKKPPFHGSSPQGKGKAAAKPSYVPGKGHK